MKLKALTILLFLALFGQVVYCDYDDDEEKAMNDTITMLKSTAFFSSWSETSMQVRPRPPLVPCCVHPLPSARVRISGSRPPPVVTPSAVVRCFVPPRAPTRNTRTNIIIAYDCI